MGGISVIVRDDIYRFGNVQLKLVRVDLLRINCSKNVCSTSIWWCTIILTLFQLSNVDGYQAGWQKVRRIQCHSARRQTSLQVSALNLLYSRRTKSSITHYLFLPKWYQKDYKILPFQRGHVHFQSFLLQGNSNQTCLFVNSVGLYKLFSIVTGMGSEDVFRQYSYPSCTATYILRHYIEYDWMATFGWVTKHLD